MVRNPRPVPGVADYVDYCSITTKSLQLTFQETHQCELNCFRESDTLRISIMLPSGTRMVQNPDSPLEGIFLSVTECAPDDLKSD